MQPENKILRPIQQRSLSHTALVLSTASLLLLVGASACQAAAPKGTFTPATGQFAPCPASPNCVSTQTASDDAEHAIAPLAYSDSAAAAKERLLAAVSAMPRATLITDEVVAGGTYLHFEFRSFFFRFVDDVEFYINEATSTIEFRSASRVGYSDLGVNRKRMEEIRAKFQR